ncbi:MAG: hypothetical protein ACRDHZ_22050, partial [Ktedonobacteraceae bacterium]
MPNSDSISAANAFIKVVQTEAVDPWLRDTNGGYIVRAIDSPYNSQAVVGLFLDSISTSQKNYAALVVNPRAWPSLTDPADTTYYNAGLPLKDHCHTTLGDIDVRKVYLKLDLTKTDSRFSNHTYYVVRDLWHPDSTWLLDKDSTFAVYIKPGDAKFLYFEPGIAVNVAARTGTDTGMSTASEFCFNNGRRVAEIENHTRDVVTYTRSNKLYVSYPASGFTFGASSDLSSGDNIITGYEQALDTTHFCARPSITVGPNDTSVALTYWYKGPSGNGSLAAAYRKDPSSSWSIVTLPGTYPDASADNSMVTPVITPISDTSWFVLAGSHITTGWSGLVGAFLITKPGTSPHAAALLDALIPDYTRPDHSVAYALFPTVAWRRYAQGPLGL